MFSIEKAKIDNGEVTLTELMGEMLNVPAAMEIALRILECIDDTKPGVDDECDEAISELFFWLGAMARYFEMLEPIFGKYLRYEYETEKAKETDGNFLKTPDVG